MRPEDIYFRLFNNHMAWQRYCGFLDLSVSSFMEIQEHLLLEQIGHVADSPLGQKMMKRMVPRTVEEFRKNIRLTTYPDYAPLIGEGQEDSLAETPHYWVHTSYKQGTFKRVPWTCRFHEVQIRNIMSALILSSATKRGDVRLRPGCKILAIVPERPFVSAHLAFGLAEQFSAKAVLPLESCETLPFSYKVDAALENALCTDIDYIISMASSFMPIQRSFERMCENGNLFSNLKKMNHKVALRMLRHRAGNMFKKSQKLAPKDLWGIKGIVAWGADSDASTPVIQNHWGSQMLQCYGSSEAGMLAIQDWQKNGMTLLPDSVFLEFLPEDEADGGDAAPTLLINELQPGKRYEPIITSLYGMPFLRYRQGDLVEVIATAEDGHGTKLPKFIFHNRADDLVDLFGIARIVTTTIEEALVLTDIDRGAWSVRKAYESGHPVVKIYIELNKETNIGKFGHKLHRKLMSVDRHYAEAAFIMGYNPIKVVPLRRGTFDLYARVVRNKGVASHVARPPQMNIPESVAEKLVQFSQLNMSS